MLNGNFWILNQNDKCTRINLLTKLHRAADSSDRPTTLQKLESFHLHRVVELSAGIKDDYVSASATDANKHHRVNPVEKLKEALSSKDAFQKYYLVSRNSMTWKFELSFYGHLQTARSIVSIRIET